MERLSESRARKGCRKRKGGGTSGRLFEREERSGHESKGKPSRFEKERSFREFELKQRELLLRERELSLKENGLYNNVSCVITLYTQR